MRPTPILDWYMALIDNTILASIISSTNLFVRLSKTCYQKTVSRHFMNTPHCADNIEDPDVTSFEQTQQIKKIPSLCTITSLEKFCVSCQNIKQHNHNVWTWVDIKKFTLNDNKGRRYNNIVNKHWFKHTNILFTRIWAALDPDLNPTS